LFFKLFDPCGRYGPITPLTVLAATNIEKNLKRLEVNGIPELVTVQWTSLL